MNEVLIKKDILRLAILASGGFVLQFCVIAADPEGLVQKCVPSPSGGCAGWLLAWFFDRVGKDICAVERSGTAYICAAAASMK